ncbi:putative ABC transport system permease protein [Hathewaya proteolytica DSM 3090]|uniref:Putative ABC transport system permease protein n=1 Tax=Hathewaya proteolytica DSM 3090 TaxID=1121331 RepID=A0A1M6PFQ9_9CLOT|nr:ABC transporter permease [Hathewaya proteolytica]SHK06786.1 putative ABC transport system permease protein [Hathewaya proteolytica DSM 3090]
MSNIVEIQLWQFSLIYVLLLVTLFVMKKCHINKTKLLVVASIRMTVQLTLAGLILSYIFKNPHPAYTVLYLILMTSFAIYRVLSKNKGINNRFKMAIACSIAFSGVIVMVFFICVVVGESMFNPQYVIPIGGMIMGNTMTGATLGIKTFRESLNGQRTKINALLNIGVTPEKILLPFVKQALETALLPTMNSMLGMGIVALPGMMTGQILSGTLPTTAILYQIAIVIAICTVVCLSSFGSLYFGYKTLYNKKNQITFLQKE